MTTNKALFVFDTSVLVSAIILPLSVPQKALSKALHTGKIVHSLATLDELKQVLERRKFDKYISREERIRVFTSLLREALLVEVTVKINACRDPKDNKFLELGVSAKAQAIVSGDSDLLDLHPFQNVESVTPGAFLAED